jgi:predicted metalloprotease with PDZ domain
VRRTSFALLVYLSFLHCGEAVAASDDPTDVAYTLRLEQPLQLTIELETPASRDSRTTLRVAEHWGGVSAGGQDLTDLTAEDSSGHALPVHRPADHRWEVEHSPGTRLRIRYRIRPNLHQQSDDPATYRRPVLNSELFHAIGELFLITPDHLEETEARNVRLAYEGFEEAQWNWASSFAAESPSEVHQISLQQLRQSVFLAGKIQVLRREIFAEDLVIAIQDDGFRFEPDSFADTQSFSLAMQRGTDLKPDSDSYQAVIRLLAHEMFHEWNGVQLGREAPEELCYWFSEGFTDFYARRILLRGGWIDAGQYASWLNEVLVRYFTSPVAAAPNEQIREGFWQSPDLQKLPYQRGDLVALLVDHEMRKASGGERCLDHLMRDLVEESREGLRVSTPLLLSRIKAETSERFAAHLEDVIVHGKTPHLPKDLFLPCLRLQEQQIQPFALGFETPTTQGQLAEGVQTASAAYRAGLRDGQRLLSFSIYYDNPDQPVRLTVESASGPKTISYKPVGTPVTVPQFEVCAHDCSESCPL